MRLQDLPADVLVLVLRLGLVFILYLFLLSIFLLARRELRQQAARGRSGPGRLVVVEAGATSLPPGQALPLQPVTTLGRAHGCTLALDDTYVSATHAVLTWHDGRWWLRDAGSTNGTLLNDQPVPEDETPVTYGDVIGVGTARLRLAP
ncbi:MAG TPA: FHA domain-containing protein [Chloroflexota bacterium]|nr:FHA domain-containing protein [Chloroflexota bacterium]